MIKISFTGETGPYNLSAMVPGQPKLYSRQKSLQKLHANNSGEFFIFYWAGIRAAFHRF